MRRDAVIVTVLTLAAIAACVIVGTAYGHDADGQPNWIQQHKSKQGEQCCGPNECERLSEADAVPTKDGVWLPRFKEMVPYEEATPSEDKYSWRCHVANGRGRSCFFFKYGAT